MQPVVIRELESVEAQKVLTVEKLPSTTEQ